jgi:hypothetical protein
MNKESCETCRYWLLQRVQMPHVGLCRAHPPLPVLDSDDERVFTFPQVYSNDWCGEYTLPVKVEVPK